MRNKPFGAIEAGTSLGALTVHAVASLRSSMRRPRSGLPPAKRSRERLVRIGEVLDRVPVNRATIYKWMKIGRFPRQVALGANSAGWYESDIDAWIADPTGWPPSDTS